jgi:hypothetical protein
VSSIEDSSKWLQENTWILVFYTVSSRLGRAQQEQQACSLQDATHSGLIDSKVQRKPLLQRHPTNINSSVIVSFLLLFVLLEEFE